MGIRHRTDTWGRRGPQAGSPRPVSSGGDFWVRVTHSSLTRLFKASAGVWDSFHVASPQLCLAVTSH